MADTRDTRRTDLEALDARVRQILKERDLAWDELGVAVGEVHPGGPVNIFVRLIRPGTTLDINMTAATVDEVIADFVANLADVKPSGLRLARNVVLRGGPADGELWALQRVEDVEKLVHPRHGTRGWYERTDEIEDARTVFRWVEW